MNNLVSSENIDKILFGITDKILLDINNKDITENQKTILTKVNNLISNGNGLKILTDNGNYKECNPEELKTAINNTDNVFDLFNITSSDARWDTKANNLMARYYLTADIYDNKIYCIGGYTGTIVNNHDCYDITTNTWSSKANILSSRYIFTSSIYEDKIYVIGGYSGGVLNTNECYDISTNTWSTKANMLTARSAPTSIAYNGKIYVFGGIKNECYDIFTNTWSTKANMLTSRASLTSAICRDKVYVLGGNSTGSNKNECYDITTDTWSTKCNLPTGRIYLSCSPHKDKIYVFGGAPSIISNKNECYDTTTDTWTTKIDMLTGRAGLASVISDNIIYCIGGYTTGSVPSDKNEIYFVEYDTYDLILPDAIQNKLDVIKQNGLGTKILADNGIYIEIPKGYRYMNEGEINNLITNLSNKINGGE